MKKTISSSPKMVTKSDPCRNNSFQKITINFFVSSNRPTFVVDKIKY